MSFHPLSLTIPHIAYACLGGFVVLFGMFSLFIREKLYIGEACWAFLFGVIIGPYGAGVFDPRSWANNNEQVSNAITLEVTRVVLAIGVFAIGVELPKAYVARHWKSLFFLLVPVMTWGWFVSAGFIYAFIPGLNFLSSLAVAACLTPTDPILAAAVVGGKYADKHVPAHIRHLLSAECGCNDGAAYPFLFLALYLILDTTPASAMEHWFLYLWLYEIVLSVVFGSTLGFAFRHLMKFCERNDLIDRQSYVAQYVSLAFLTIGIMTMVGSDDLLAAFCCGTAFAWDGFFNRQTEEAVFSSVIDLLFNVASFVYVGAWMPFESFSNETLTLSVRRLIAIAILILIFKRLPIMIALYKFIPDVKTFREALFSGHFGPIGIGAIYIATFAVGYLPTASNPPANQAEFVAATIQPIVAFIVLCSVAIHGLSIPFFSLGRRVHSVSSRTWSRHAAPDWATQMRHITRGEDVVINRDPDASAMEKGEGGLTEEEKSIMDSKLASIAGSSTPSPQREDSGNSDTRTDATLRDEEAMKEESPPDGSETILEWREGPHKVIERRAGPGEEVNVEIIRNAFEPTKKDSSVHLKAAAGTAIRTSRDYLQQFRHAAEQVQKRAEQAGETIEHDLQVAGARAREVVSATRASTGDNFDRSTEGEPGYEDDWASDLSGDDVSVKPSGDRRKRPRQGKGKAVPKQIGVGLSRKGRRRSSMSEQSSLSAHTRPSLVDQSQLQSPPPSGGDVQDPSDVPEATDWRGRSSPPERQGSDLSAPQSIKHRRLESLRLHRHSRDESPSRSVRFADEERSGMSTQRNSMLQNEPWFASNQVGDSPVDEDEGSMKERVTSELPPPKR
ncbi:Sodium/hydrogen exchanger family-domain-containing protein [Melanogaster broomeanus]|nr:Sodium/hydrogen exchanger family-domain-containing protein [Melanogaster broomeanus]